MAAQHNHGIASNADLARRFELFLLSEGEKKIEEEVQSSM